MRLTRSLRALTGVSLLAATSVLATGCGNLSIRTWIKIVEDQSTGSVKIGNGAPKALSRVQGGFLGTVVVSTQNLLAPLNGTIRIEDARIATEEPTLLGTACVWADPALPSTGTVVLDILGGDSSADLTLNLLAQTELSTNFGFDPVSLAQTAHFDLGSGLDLQTLLDAEANGTADGLFATQAQFAGTADFGLISALFTLDVTVTNESTPPEFDSDLLDFCAPNFAEQGNDLFYGVNSKGSYLLANQTDNPKPPTIIDLEKLGAVPGNTLRLKRIGTFNNTTELKDGTATNITGVFSSSSTIRGTDQKNRVAGAINAGTDVVTPKATRCFLLLCLPTSTDIAEDFKIDPSVDVVIPNGAKFLIVAPLANGLTYADNSGFGFGVSVEVLP